MLDVFLMDEEDIEAVHKIETETFASMAWSRKDFEHAVQSDYDHALVIRRAGNVGGRGTVAAYAVVRILGPEAELDNICVEKNYRGQGLGNRLMDEVLRLVRDKSVSNVFLEVRKSNEAARSLYRKYNFTDQYTRTNYYRDPLEDAVIMKMETR